MPGLAQPRARQTDTALYQRHARPKLRPPCFHSTTACGSESQRHHEKHDGRHHRRHLPSRPKTAPATQRAVTGCTSAPRSDPSTLSMATLSTPGWSRAGARRTAPVQLRVPPVLGRTATPRSSHRYRVSSGVGVVRVRAIAALPPSPTSTPSFGRPRDCASFGTAAYLCRTCVL